MHTLDQNEIIFTIAHKLHSQTFHSTHTYISHFRFGIITSHHHAHQRQVIAEHMEFLCKRNAETALHGGGAQFINVVTEKEERCYLAP